METRDFDPTSLEVARKRIDTLFDAFVAATGIPITPASEILAGDKAFVSRYKRTNITFGTYDMVAGRASSLWPEGAEWPQDVPRPSPSEVPPDAKAEFDRRRETVSAAANATPELPGGAEWPNDIPQPGAKMEAVNG